MALLGRLNVSRFPWEERIGVAVCQARAARDWIEAVRSAKARLRYQRLFYRPAHAKPQQTLTYSVQTPLSCFLVDRGHPNRQ